MYLVSGKRCLAKAKTATARRTLDPLYQQQLVFHEKYSGCVLQVRNFIMDVKILTNYPTCAWILLNNWNSSVCSTDIQNWVCFSISGDDMGWLQPDRGQEGVHGRGSNHVGRLGLVEHRHRLVQTLRNLLSRQPTSKRTTKERLASKFGLLRLNPINFSTLRRVVAFIPLPSPNKLTNEQTEIVFTCFD